MGSISNPGQIRRRSSSTFIGPIITLWQHCNYLSSAMAIAGQSKVLKSYTVPTDIVTSTTGKEGTTDYRIWHHQKLNQSQTQKISSWDDITLQNPLSKNDKSEPIFNFVCEIPKGTVEKFEIQTKEEGNPIGQDTKKDKKTGEVKLRSYKYKPDIGSIVNYGAFPQTYEDPQKEDFITNIVGDGDPLDVLELGEKKCEYRGQILGVRVLGAIALIDGGETDWKIIVRNINDLDESKKSDTQLLKDRIVEVREWFRMYKTAEGKPENVYHADGKLFSKTESIKVIRNAYKSWMSLKKRRNEIDTFDIDDEVTSDYSAINEEVSNGEL